MSPTDVSIRLSVRISCPALLAALVAPDGRSPATVLLDLEAPARDRASRHRGPLAHSGSMTAARQITRSRIVPATDGQGTAVANMTVAPIISGNTSR